MSKSRKDAANNVRRELDESTKEVVLARDNFRCVICHKRGVDVHEIIPRSALGKSKSHILFAEKNRVCLCREHHQEAHNSVMRTYLIKLLQSMYKYEYNEEEYQKYLIEENDDD